MSSLRNVLFQIHLWTGLIAGIFFILLGLSGSALVYPGLLQSSVAVPKATAQGAPLPLEKIIAAARETTPQSEGRVATVTLPQAAGDALMVQFNAQRGGQAEGQAGGQRGPRGGARRANRPNGAARGQGGARGPEGGRGGNQKIFVDPVSGQVLGSSTAAPSPLLGIAHQMHEAMLLGGMGRTLVAWLGVGMFFLGLSGLYLWWPKKGQWKFAFGMRHTARGFRLYREIHGMMGIWFWLVFLVVTATSIPLGFPSVMGMFSGNASRREGPPAGFRQAQIVEAPDGTASLPLANLIANAERISGAKAIAVSVPTQPDRPLSVRLENSDDYDAAGSIALNPYTGAALSRPNRVQEAVLNRGTIELLHGGQRLGPVWKLLVFLSGFLPMIFVVTGFMMWLKKRQKRNAPTQAA